MYKTIIPNLVSIDTDREQIRGSYLFDYLNFFPDTIKPLRFHYKLEVGEITKPDMYDFRHGYYTYTAGTWHYARKLKSLKFMMSYKPSEKIFRVNRAYTRLPLEIGSILPVGKHISDMINLDLTLAGFTIIRGCAYENDNGVSAIIRPSYNGKTSLLKTELRKGSRYIAEDILVLNLKRSLIYPTAANYQNYGRKINQSLYSAARQSTLTAPTRCTVIQLGRTLGEDRPNSKSNALYNYTWLNSMLFMDNLFIRAYIFANNFSLRLNHTLTPDTKKLKLQIEHNLDSNSVNRQHWNDYGGDYENTWSSPAKQVMSLNELNFVTKHIPKPQSHILDIGIGSGRIINHMMTRIPDAKIYGVDIADSMVQHCKGRFGHLPQIERLEVCDISTQDLPFDRKFDAITAIRVLKYNKNWKDIVAKLTKSLASGGILIFSMTNYNSINRLGRYHIPFERTTPNELRKLSHELDVNLIAMQTFTRVPDALYDYSKNDFYNHLLLLTENSMRVFGKYSLGRELFIAVQRGT